MLMQLTGRSRDDARNALSRANGRVKVAVMLLQGSDLESAKSLLSDAGDQLGLALDCLGKVQVSKD
jgi:N-acetylmuramic acid 6-phosphate etherase